MKQAFIKTYASLPETYHRHPGAFSVLLKNVLVEKFMAREGRGEPDERLRNGFPDRTMVEVMGNLALEIGENELSRLIDESGIDVELNDLDSFYRKRVAQRALEYLVSSPVCPEVLIMPGSVSFEIINPPQIPIHGIAFEYFPFVANEFYALAVDCLSSNVEQFGREKILPVAFQESWFDHEGVHRCLWWTGPEDDLLMESSLIDRVRPISVQTIFSSPSIHRNISDRCRLLRIPEINSFQASSVADDKYACYERWKKASVPTPESIRIAKGSNRDAIVRTIHEWVAGRNKIVVQPNLGTEGQGVRAFETSSELESAFKYVHELVLKQDAIVREARGNVFYRLEGSNSLYACDLRLNVCYDGQRYHADSGYMQVASSPDEFASSISIGGKVIEFHKDTLEHLMVREPSGDVQPLQLTESDREHIADIACKAARCLPGIWLLGIDLKLEAHRDGDGKRKVQVFVLDANPRPAGLMHSDRFPLKNLEPEPCICPRLWVAFDKLF